MSAEHRVPGDDVSHGHSIEHLLSGRNYIELGIEVHESSLGIDVGAVAELVYLGVDGEGGRDGRSARAGLESGGNGEGVWVVTGSEHLGVEGESVSVAMEGGGGPYRASP